ncbi:AbaSI family restriction endonuclease [Oligosphaera ethanolica]|uniref:SET and RING associated domain-containing protein n=1 Tax=Oligosphaera ethanolica TaxID=760260 RepID=A0AAE4APK6_9BACT|nr:hypothetical protein [Oligosphaera ethanolica]MDQ0289512.1 hypothetical protein [Oligosphaera ethanolica]
MDKLEHVSIMLNRRTKGKRYENFVINSIYTKLSNPELIPITQQYVRNKNHSVTNSKKYYLLDLYFPQLQYGVEVDESHHLSDESRINDEIRAEDILSSIQCKQGRIAIYNDNGSLKAYDEVNKQINREVNIINNMVLDRNKKTGQKLKWEDNSMRKTKILEKGLFNIEDDVDYEGITEIYNYLGHSVKNLGRCFVKLNDKYKLWVPSLAVQLEDGSVKTKNGWKNTLNEDKTIITEVVGDMNRCDTRTLPDGSWNENKYKRIVFMHIRDCFGLDRLRFLGVFEANDLKKSKGIQTRSYSRTAKKISFSELVSEET